MTDTKMTTIEALARAWIVCDPNRQPTNPDSVIDRDGGTLSGRQEWAWFIPRAEATIEFLAANGFKVVRDEQ